MPISPRYSAKTTHLSLGPSFFDAVKPATFPEHLLRYRNQHWSSRVGLEQLTAEEWLNHFGRFQTLPDNLPEPLALRYHGHQFGSYNPDLGDGRGFLFAQMSDCNDGRLLDLGTKGSGQTPWSRQGDGRLTLNGGVREVLATEMLEALGVTTSKSFSLIETGEDLMRGDEPSPTRSSVLVRLSHSHIRIGTFQRLATLGDQDGIRRLLDHSIQHYLPTADDESQSKRAVKFVAEVAARVAKMGAEWMAAGFVHGVINSDNVNITGESFDYGPWRFLPHYDPEFTAAYFDQNGRYAYARQPGALWWNLARLAETLLEIGTRDELSAALDGFEPALQKEFAAAVTRRLGIAPQGLPADGKLANAFMSALLATKAPFEQSFFDWHGGPVSESRALSGPSAEHYGAAQFAAFRTLIGGYAPSPEAKLDHPYFRRERPCTMLIEEVETILRAVNNGDNWRSFETKLQDISAMSEAYRPASRSFG